MKTHIDFDHKSSLPKKLQSSKNRKDIAIAIHYDDCFFLYFTKWVIVRLLASNVWLLQNWCILTQWHNWVNESEKILMKIWRENRGEGKKKFQREHHHVHLVNWTCRSREEEVRKKIELKEDSGCVDISRNKKKILA